MIAAVQLRAAGTRLRPSEVADAAVLLLAQDPDVRMWNPRWKV